MVEITQDMIRRAAFEIWLVDNRGPGLEWAKMAWDDMGGSDAADERVFAEITAEKALRAAFNPEEEVAYP